MILQAALVVSKLVKVEVLLVEHCLKTIFRTQNQFCDTEDFIALFVICFSTIYDNIRIDATNWLHYVVLLILYLDEMYQETSPSMIDFFVIHFKYTREDVKLLKRHMLKFLYILPLASPKAIARSKKALRQINGIT